MKIGFIGAGKMATALAKGMINQNVVQAADITMSDINDEALASLRSELGVNTVKDNQQLIVDNDVVFLAIKPNVILDVLESTKDQITNQLLISIAAGLDLKHLQTALPETAALIRVMPNITATVGEAAIAVCHNDNVNEQQLQLAHKLLASAGEVFDLPEDKFSLFTAISGSSPAFTFLYIDSLSRAAVKHGMPKALADKICSQAVLGSAKYMQSEGKNPWDLIDAVSSPGGTTVAGLLELQAEGFSTAVVKAVDATIQKDQDLNK